MARPVTSDELRRRVIEPTDFVADTEAFVDVRLARSKGKASYSFIGPGVSQNADQTVNLCEPHGFNVGAATVPSGQINNQHLHYTAEVFICTRGKWRLNVGEHSDQTLDLSAGDVISVPTWIFRGFENLGDDDGWLFAILGGDDTGGILWAPGVLREAAETGLYLGRDYSVLDAFAGDDISDAVQPVPSDQITVDRYTDDELAQRRVGLDDLQWSDRALLSTVLEGHGCRLAPVIGHGMSQDRGQRAPITNPHTFALEWLEVAPGSSTGQHRHHDSQVLLLIEGDWEVALNEGADRVTDRPATGSVVSVPAGAWRDFVNVGSEAARALVVNGSDAPVALEWPAPIEAAAAERGWALDRSGFMAPRSLLGGRA